MLTPELQAAIVAAVEAGATPEAAAVARGVSATTYYRWTAAGREGRAPYRDFWESIQRATATLKETLESTIATASIKDWKAAAWYAERRFRLDWSAKAKGDEAPPPPAPEPADLLDALRERLRATRTLREAAHRDGSYVAAGNLLRMEVDILAKVQAEESRRLPTVGVSAEAKVDKLIAIVPRLPGILRDRLRAALAEH